MTLVGGKEGGLAVWLRAQWLSGLTASALSWTGELNPAPASLIARQNGIRVHGLQQGFWGCGRLLLECSDSVTAAGTDSSACVSRIQLTRACTRFGQGFHK